MNLFYIDSELFKHLDLGSNIELISRPSAKHARNVVRGTNRAAAAMGTVPVPPVFYSGAEWKLYGSDNRQAGIHDTGVVEHLEPRDSGAGWGKRCR